jgi:LacI family transcriptional regulator
MRADIRQVATEAGVSTATVSRVLTGKGPASEAAINRVRAAAERLGYSPSASASSLRTDRSMIIGVLVPNLANPVFLPFLRAVEHLAQRHGYAVIVADAQRSPEVERRQLDRLSAQRIDALVVAGRASDPDHIRHLAESGLAVADADAFSTQADVLAASAGNAIDDALDHLASLNHTHVALLSQGHTPGATSGSRWYLIERSAQARGVTVERVVVSGPEVLAGPGMAELLDSLVRQPGGPTALWSSSHTLAPRLLEGLSTAEVALPAECSFLTFGDSPWAGAYRPGISVLTGDLGSIGSVMTERLLHTLGVLDAPPSTDILPDRYVPRASVGPAASP